MRKVLEFTKNRLQVALKDHDLVTATPEQKAFDSEWLGFGATIREGIVTANLNTTPFTVWYFDDHSSLDYYPYVDVKLVSQLDANTFRFHNRPKVWNNLSGGNITFFTAFSPVIFKNRFVLERPKASRFDATITGFPKGELNGNEGLAGNQQFWYQVSDLPVLVA